MAQINGHILYETGDQDAPDSIKDRNGDVVLGLCKICGAGEVELNESCKERQTNRMIRKSKELFDSLSPDEQEAHRKAQQEIWVRGEMGIGSDADEAAYRAAMRDEDAP